MLRAPVWPPRWLESNRIVAPSKDQPTGVTGVPFWVAGSALDCSKLGLGARLGPSLGAPAEAAPPAATDSAREGASSRQRRGRSSLVVTRRLFVVQNRTPAETVRQDGVV